MDTKYADLRRVDVGVRRRGRFFDVHRRSEEKEDAAAQERPPSA
jgi:hypothetical protein